MRYLIKLFFPFYILAGCYTSNVIGQNDPEDISLLNEYDRPSISLDGQWQIIIDPLENGYYDYRYQPKADGFFMNLKPKNKSELIEYDFDKADKLIVPGDWNSQKPELLWYEGTIWYKKDFNYQRKNEKRTFLHFGAVNYEAKVYLNGEKLGDHIGGFTPFCFEITDKVKDGNNFVVVKVDNKRRADGIPTLNCDWWNYGGITRPVKIMEVSQTFIQDYCIQLKKGEERQISGYVKVAGNDIPQEVIVNIPELKFHQAFKTDQYGWAKIEFSQKMELWSPENPKLYDVQIKAGSDEVSDKIGFRTIETKGQDILLNGKSIFLRGICIHEEAPYRSGRAYTVEDARTLLGWAKELGCNYVRLAHYPHNENMIREAERMGLLVWAEVPLYWTIQWENGDVLANAKNQFYAMFQRDKNRAAVILWSLANETPLSDARLSSLTKFAKYIRTIDNTRLLTAALESHREVQNPNSIMINDPLGKYLDVLGCNEYYGWYVENPEICKNLEWKTTYDKPLIMSEFGAGALYGLHGDKLERWTEEFQKYFFEENLKMLKKIPFLRGTTPWILMDFRSARRPLGNIQDYYNRKGLISNQGQKKKAFYTMKNYYEEIKNNFK